MAPGAGDPGKRSRTAGHPSRPKAVSPLGTAGAPPSAPAGGDDPFGFHLPRTGQRAAAGDGAATPGDAADGPEHDGYNGVFYTVEANTRLVGDPWRPALTFIDVLSAADRVKPLELGADQDFNQGRVGTDEVWWKVRVKRGPHAGLVGYVQQRHLGGTIDVQRRGQIEFDGDVDGGVVTVGTAQQVDVHGMGVLHDAFTLSYEGADAERSRWLQFVWREVVGVLPGGTSKARDEAITTTAGTYHLTANGTYARAGFPLQGNYNVDSMDPTDPFYDAAFLGDRTAESATTIDMPTPLWRTVQEAFGGGAVKVVSRAHFHAFLVKGRRVVFETGFDVNWRFDHEGVVAPGVYGGARSQVVNSLPPVLAERLHERFPATEDIE